MSSTSLRITEHDEAGNVTATYVQTPSHDKGSRIDVILPTDTKSLWQKALDVFLPVGYPNSVTHDYLEYDLISDRRVSPRADSARYQIYDSLQAFSSSIASLLSSRAVLSSVGVGDADASPTAALLLSIFQESAGRLATILFAHRFGTALEPECKMYRLLADILNDTGFLLDCLSPVFPKPIRVVILSFSSVLRALCGVAAGSAKASLSAHFAQWGNLGELNAKDSSQETVISLVGMWAGTLVVTWVTTPLATWTALILLLSIHLETNRRAVRAVSMRTLNRQRATLVYHHLQKGHVPSPEDISADERIFERDGVLRSATGDIIGHCTVGAPISRLLRTYSSAHHTSTDSLKLESDVPARILSQYSSTPYVLWPAPGGRVFSITLKKDVTPRDILVAWWQALAMADRDTRAQQDPSDDMRIARALLAKHEEELRARGWDLDSGALETRASGRIEIG